MGIIYKIAYIGDEVDGLKPFCTPYETEHAMLKRKKDGYIGIHSLGDKYSMNTFDIYIYGTLVYQYIIPLGYLIFAYTRMAFKLWRNKIPGKFKIFLHNQGSKENCRRHS